MAPVKKSKSAKSSENINSRLQLVVKSGKVGFEVLGIKFWWSSGHGRINVSRMERHGTMRTSGRDGEESSS